MMDVWSKILIGNFTLNNMGNLVVKASRGRPRAVLFSPVEVADLLSVDAGRVERALWAEKLRQSVFPGAFFLNGAWSIPERDVRALLGPGLPRLFSVAEFAELIGFSESYVYAVIDGGLIQCRVVFGLKRIPATQYFELPADRPASDAPRPSFFSERSEEAGNE